MVRRVGVARYINPPYLKILDPGLSRIRLHIIHTVTVVASGMHDMMLLFVNIVLEHATTIIYVNQTQKPGTSSTQFAGVAHHGCMPRRRQW